STCSRWPAPPRTCASAWLPTATRAWPRWRSRRWPSRSTSGWTSCGRWPRSRPYVEAGGMRFAPAGEYQVFPTRDKPLKPYAAVVRAAREMGPLVAEVAPHVVVADILTLAPALAGEVAGVPVATVVPHVFPVGAPGFPPYALGARLPRTIVGRGLWNALRGPVGKGERQGRDELNETRRRL